MAGERARNGGGKEVAFSPYQISVTYQGAGAGAGWFGPLNPMSPVAPPEVAGRQWDYPSGYNLALQPRPYEPISFAQLRSLADSYDVLRTVIETRKDQMTRQTWSIKVKEKGAKGKVAERKASPKIDALTAFFQKPDKRNSWARWLRLLLEDLFVLDAPALYVLRTRGGDLYALEPVDGATIKPVIDDWGHIVLAPEAGYQQILKGLPAVDYTTEELIYSPRNIRTNRVYGFSPVEQIVTTVNIALRRQKFQLSYYTEGNIPEALIGTPVEWNPDQIIAFQNYFDSMLAGNLDERRRAKFVPGELAKNFMPTKEPALTGEMDTWLARVVCFAFSISPQPFLQMMNRATAETSQEVAIEEGLFPIQLWVKELIDGIIADPSIFNSPEIEFVWNNDKEADPKTASEIRASDVKMGILKINEAREELGLEPVPGGDMAMVLTATGYVPVEYEEPDPMLMMPPVQNGPQKPGNGTQSGAEPPAGDKEEKPKKETDEKPAEKHASCTHGEVGKAATIPFVKARRFNPHPYAPRAEKLRKAYKRAIAPLLKALGADMAAQVRKSLKHLGKAAADGSGPARDNAGPLTPAELSLADYAWRMTVEHLDWSGWEVLIDPSEAYLTAMFEQTGRAALLSLGISDEKIVDVVNDKAVAYARERSAEMVGMSYNAAGDLVANPDAEWAITDTTRETIRTIIADGLENNLGADEIADLIEGATAFDSDRAELIARTEIADANSQASLESYKSASDIGVEVQKQWILGPNPCPICEDNAADGVIDLDNDFSSGDDAPPAHPNCECAIVPIVNDEEE